jgi:uncharacterized protein (DUF2267 family)
MQEFVGQVQDGARLASMEQALIATRATLETLAERLGADDSRHLAAQLPAGIGQYLNGRDAVAEDFPPDEFLKRISAREGVEPPAADYHARAVLGALRRAVSSGEIRNVLGHLPAEYARLFAGTAHPRPGYGGGF